MLFTQFPLIVAAYVIHILSFLSIWLGLFYESAGGFYTADNIWKWYQLYFGLYAISWGS